VIDEAAHQLPGIDAGGLAALVEPGLSAGSLLGEGQPKKGQKIVGDEMADFLLEVLLALGIDQRRGGIGKHVVRISAGLGPLRFHENAPT